MLHKQLLREIKLRGVFTNIPKTVVVMVDVLHCACVGHSCCLHWCADTSPDRPFVIVVLGMACVGRLPCTGMWLKCWFAKLGLVVYRHIVIVWPGGMLLCFGALDLCVQDTSVLAVYVNISGQWCIAYLAPKNLPENGFQKPFLKKNSLQKISEKGPDNVRVPFWA